MRKLVTFATLIVAALFVNSCRKNKDALFDGVSCSGNCYILTGKLSDSAAGAGIADGEIKFYFDNNTGIFSNNKTYLGRAVTDVNGNYTFRFDGSRFNAVRGYYYAEAYKGNMFVDPMYLNRVANFSLDSSLYNVPFTQNFSLFKPATVKVRVVASTVTNFQYLTVSYSYGKISNGIVFNGGRTIDTIITWKTAGDLRTFVQGDAVGNGVNIQKKDTVTIPTNDTRQIEIRL